MSAPDRANYSRMSRSEVITYKEGCYSQIKLASGERIMLSITQNEIVIFKMRFLGVVPGPKIAEWSKSSEDFARFLILFGGAPQNQSPFRFIVEKLVSFDSIAQLHGFLTKELDPFEVAYQKNAFTGKIAPPSLLPTTPTPVPAERTTVRPVVRAPEVKPTEFICPQCHRTFMSKELARPFRGYCPMCMQYVTIEW